MDQKWEKLKHYYMVSNLSNFKYPGKARELEIFKNKMAFLSNVDYEQYLNSTDGPFILGVDWSDVDFILLTCETSNALEDHIHAKNSKNSELPKVVGPDFTKVENMTLISRANRTLIRLVIEKVQGLRKPSELDVDFQVFNNIIENLLKEFETAENSALNDGAPLLGTSGTSVAIRSHQQTDISKPIPRQIKKFDVSLSVPIVIADQEDQLECKVKEARITYENYKANLKCNE